MKRKPGRPASTMTEENCEAILRHVRLGIWPERAAAAAGISPGTMRAYRKRNAEFRRKLEAAEAMGEASLHGRIVKHMDKQWTAAAWMLERRWPDRWAKRDPSAVVNVLQSQEQTAAPISTSGPPAPQEGEWMGYLESVLAAAKKAGMTETPPHDAGGTERDRPPAG